MNRLEKIKDIEYKIRQLKREITDLDKKYYKAYAPKGYGTGTSYADYDTISGGNKEFHIESYYEERKKKETLLELNEEILVNLKTEIDTEEYLNLLTTDTQKVKFLRIIKGYTQARTAEMLNISDRTVRRIESENKI
ncbi:hypothetical protein [Clostridium sp.]|uniref:hypothetical protein n=1 Tax=Clostridium sp. TaxID=1506 RepID=UPI0032165BCE